jgi:hypothetical protein
MLFQQFASGAYCQPRVVQQVAYGGRLPGVVQQVAHGARLAGVIKPDVWQKTQLKTFPGALAVGGARRGRGAAVACSVG